MKQFFACCDRDSIGPTDSIPIGESKSVAQGLTDPANDNTTVTLERRDNTNRRYFYDLLMADGGMNPDSTVCREVYKKYSEMWSVEKRILADPFRTILTSEMMQTDHCCS